MEVDFSFCCLQSPDSKDTRNRERMSCEDSKIIFFIYKHPTLSLMEHTYHPIRHLLEQPETQREFSDNRQNQWYIFTLYSPTYDKFMAQNITGFVLFSRFLVDFWLLHHCQTTGYLFFLKDGDVMYINIVIIVT